MSDGDEGLIGELGSNRILAEDASKEEGVRSV